MKLLEKRLWALEQELEDKKMQMNRAAQGENRSKYDDVEENSGVAGTKKSIDELCSTITNLKGKLQAVYQLPMFKNEKYKEQKVYPLRNFEPVCNHKRYKKLFIKCGLIERWESLSRRQCNIAATINHRKSMKSGVILKY